MQMRSETKPCPRMRGGVAKREPNALQALPVYSRSNYWEQSLCASCGKRLKELWVQSLPDAGGLSCGKPSTSCN